PASGAQRPFLSCLVAGPRGAPLLLFLHGFPEAAFVWEGLIARYAGRYRCVAPNLRGYPGSYAPGDPPAYRARVGRPDLAALIQPDPPHGSPAAAVIAHHWGGALAWGLAGVAPQLMQRLIILTAPRPDIFLAALREDPAQQAASAYMNMLRTPGIESALAADDFARMWPFFERFGGATWLTPALRERYRQTWSATPVASEDGVDTATSALTGPLNYYRASPLYPPTSPQDPIHNLVLPAAMLHVRLPTSVIWGEADTALPPSLLDGLAHYVSDLHITRL